MLTLDELAHSIDVWGHDKGILPNPDPLAQFRKTEEEIDELHRGIIYEDLEEIKDAIGDVFVTLVMQCGAWDLTMQECVQQAYDTISKRTGKMVDGQFVKDAD